MDASKIGSNPSDAASLVRDKSKEKKAPTNEMGKDQFLQLMIAQLQNQDPTAPMTDQNYIAQMAQFTQLETMSNMTNSFFSQQAYTMIGKGIIGTIKNPDTGVLTDVAGTVDSAGMESGKAYVMVGKLKVMLDDVTQVYDPNALAGNPSAINAGANLTGKYVSAEIQNEDGSAINVEGYVSKMIVSNGQVLLHVGDYDVTLNQIRAVAQNKDDLGSADGMIPETE